MCSLALSMIISRCLIRADGAQNTQTRHEIRSQCFLRPSAIADELEIVVSGGGGDTKITPELFCSMSRVPTSTKATSSPRHVLWKLDPTRCFF